MTVDSRSGTANRLARPVGRAVPGNRLSVEGGSGLGFKLYVEREGKDVRIDTCRIKTLSTQ